MIKHKSDLSPSCFCDILEQIQSLQLGVGPFPSPLPLSSISLEGNVCSKHWRVTVLPSQEA